MNPCVQLWTLGRVDLSGPVGTDTRSVLAQPKRLALLLYLAAASPRGFHRKDHLLALFWPESADGRARRALNRSVYTLRQALGPDALVTRGDQELSVAVERVWCDAAAFEAALDAGSPADGLELYRGDFAPGFFVDGLGDLEHWVESERVRLRDRARAAASELASKEAEAGQVLLAARWAQRATAIAPHDERAAQQRIDLLDRAGDRAGAVRAYGDLAARLLDDLGVEPSPETQALVAAVRARRAPVTAPPTSFPSSTPTPAASAPLPAASRPHPRLIRAGIGALAVGGALTLLLVGGGPATLVLAHRSAVAVTPEFERWPALSPDGRTVFYTASDPAGDELFAQQIDGGAPVPLTAALPGSQREAALSPDGSQLLFRGEGGLYVMPALGGLARRVVAAKVEDRILNLPGLLAGAWAPDGLHIVYPERDTLFVQAIDSAGRTAVASSRSIHSPAWSSDGRWIAFVLGNPEFHIRGNLASSAIHVVPAGGGATVPVTDASALHTSPVWVPGRRALLYISDHDGGRDVYQVALGRSGRPRAPPTRITTGLDPERLSLSGNGRRLAWSAFTETANIRALLVPAADSVPLSSARAVTTGNQLIEAVGNISSDGAWLYYHGDRSGNSDLWRLPLTVGAPQKLTLDPAPDFAPSVSPDGSELAFFSLRTGTRHVFVMPAAGGPAVRVTAGERAEGVPTWSPDGRTLIWLSGDTVRLARRRYDGSWEPDVPLIADYRFGGWPQWSPDGRWVSFPTATGLGLIDPATGERRALDVGPGITWHVWSEHADTIYGEREFNGPLLFLAVPLGGGRPRAIAWADDPLTQLPRYGLALSRGRLYFPLVERRSDVWVATVRGQ
jgi:Tol biopolymer transport system component/DNA-binding SARP family transcriptional activator